MAKKVTGRNKKDGNPSGKEVNEFSGFGTKADWVVKECPTDFVKLEGIGIVHDIVIAKDDKGYYRTRKLYVGQNIADPYRQNRLRLGLVNVEALEKELAAKQEEENKEVVSD